MNGHLLSDKQSHRNRTKSKVLSKVEHYILVIERPFGFNKVHYRVWQRTASITVTCALANLFDARKHCRVTA